MNATLAAVISALLASADGAAVDAAGAEADAPVTLLQRVAVVAAQHDGGHGRVKLRHAGADARSFADVLVDLGGVPRDDVTLVIDGGVAGIESALAALAARVDEKRAEGARVEALIYYSGHSDEDGLLLGADRYPYESLQQALSRVGAHVTLAVLDSCASGSMIREKGGRHLPPFLVDESERVAGTAVLTSSSWNEVSQESDVLGGSFFTNALVSGLRGAADASGDGKVTLHEAYRFAFDETLHRTEAASGGAQHPAYDMKLSGSGDLVLTDLRAVSAGLLLADDVAGRVTVRDGGGRLVVELQKSGGAPLLLGLPPAEYVVRVVGAQNARDVREGRVTLADGKPTRVAVADLAGVALEIARARGAGPLDETVSAAVDKITYVPLDLALFPPIETNIIVGRAENTFGLAALAGRQTRLAGLDLAGLGYWVDEDGWGSMISGVANVVGGDFAGLQLAGVANVTAGNTDFSQISGVLNVGAGANRGLFLSTFNVHGSVDGAQIGVIDVAGHVRGLQLAVINVADEVEGTQIGIINVARSSTAPIGILSFVAEGIHTVGVSGSDVAPAGFRFALGGKYLYSGGGIGIAPPGYGPRTPAELANPSSLQEPKAAPYLSLGGRVPLDELAGGPVFVDIELGGGPGPRPVSRMFGGNEGVVIHNYARALFGWQPLKFLSLQAGPSLNVIVADEREFAPQSVFAPLTFDGGTVDTTLSPGVAVYVGL